MSEKDNVIPYNRSHLWEQNGVLDSALCAKKDGTTKEDMCSDIYIPGISLCASIYAEIQEQHNKVLA